MLSLSAVAAEKTVLVIHGGTGLEKKELTPNLEKEYRAGLEAAALAGFAVIKKGGSSLDAVEAAVRSMEDNPMFNAGKGAVFNHDGKNELDASIMDGATKKAGAVGAITTAKNPISVARAVMEKSPHVLIVGAGADAFAKEVGAEIVEPSYFFTERRWKYLQELLEKEKKSEKGKLKHSGLPPKKEWSTVGAVALDTKGNLAAATSTGGLTNKCAGRLGDSPIIGAGTFADNETCGVSATGHGEFFIRYGVAREICTLMKYKKLSAQKAADAVVQGTLKKAGGEGGVIVLDGKGRAAFSFNSEGLYRAQVTESGKVVVKLYE